MNNKAAILIATLALAAATPALAARNPSRSPSTSTSPPARQGLGSRARLRQPGLAPGRRQHHPRQGHKDKRGAVRTVTTKDGAKLVEELLSHQDSTRSLKYRIIDSPLPVSDYVSTLKVKAAKGGSRVEWSSTFKRKDEAEGADNAGAKKAVAGIYTSGLGALKQQLEAK
jgi:hypothetical protein